MPSSNAGNVFAECDGPVAVPAADEPRDTAQDVTSAGRLSSHVSLVAVADLGPSYSPRSDGENDAHLSALLESDADFPPIIVQSGTNRVIDGMHRVRVAQARGEHTIRCRFFDGDDNSAFLLAVRMNVDHGLPLSLADRKSAARRILLAHEAWSDRAIGLAAGLSHKTVSSLRLEPGHPASPVRIGRDGAARPLSPACGRERVRMYLLAHPEASLRQAAAAAGVSPGTVRAVREALRLEAEATAPRPSTGPGVTVSRPEQAVDVSSTEARNLVRVLRADPSIRLTESGRMLLSLASVASMTTAEHHRLTAALPPHHLASVSQLASACTRAWQLLEQLISERRADL